MNKFSNGLAERLDNDEINIDFEKEINEIQTNLTEKSKKVEKLKDKVFSIRKENNVLKNKINELNQNLDFSDNYRASKILTNMIQYQYIYL